MTPRERILDSAAKIFSQYGYRLASMELVAQACGLTRQALYHHFDSKEALFRAVVEAVHENALEAERAAAAREEQAGKGLADVMVAQLQARYRYRHPQAAAGHLRGVLRRPAREAAGAADAGFELVELEAG